MEIYETGDIELLTFYEFIQLEEYYNIFFGFLSALGDKRYNFIMRDSINKIKNAKIESNKKINKKERRNYDLMNKKKFKSTYIILFHLIIKYLYKIYFFTVNYNVK